MPKLPNSTKLLGQVLREKPHTHQGQINSLQMVKELVEKCGLGVAEIFMYPVTDKFGPDEITREFPLLKIQSEFGTPSYGEHSVLLPGHADTVDLKGPQKNSDALIVKDDVGYGRGTLDMWGGNIAYLQALQLLKDNGARRRIQTVLSTREEVGSEVLDAAIKARHIDPYDFFVTTEITTHEREEPTHVYNGRTGRFGIDVHIDGAETHAGLVDKYPEILEKSPLRFVGRALDHLFDQDKSRYCSIANKHPDDTTGALASESRLLPNMLIAKPTGLSLPDADLHFNCFHNNPELAAESVRSVLEEYLTSDLVRIPPEYLKVTLEDRNGVPFTEPWLTPDDHPLVQQAHDIAKQISGNTELGLGGASGVAEDGRFSDKPGVGWGCDGIGAHEADEQVVLSSIDKRAAWIQQIVNFDGKLE